MNRIESAAIAKGLQIDSINDVQAANAIYHAIEDMFDIPSSSFNRINSSERTLSHDCYQKQN